MNTADIEMAQLNEAGNMISRYERSRGCACQSLRWTTCNHCGHDFGTDERWYAFLDAVGNGTFDEADYLKSLGA